MADRIKWYDVYNLEKRYRVGCIEVDYDKIVRTSPGYRWALGKNFNEFCARSIDDVRFCLIQRFTINCKSYDAPAKKVKDMPSDSQLYQRVSP